MTERQFLHTWWHCEQMAKAKGVDVMTMRENVASAIERVYNGDSPRSLDFLRTFFGDEKPTPEMFMMQFGPLMADSQKKRCVTPTEKCTMCAENGLCSVTQDRCAFEISRVCAAKG